jgi:tRNA G18 (ribose-2'-O)-methylase SpoU
MEGIVGHKLHHNVMMHGIRPDETPLEKLGERIIMLDNITSTENVGAIARSAAALGVEGYLLPAQGPHPYGRRALRVSMGYVSRLAYHRYDDIFVTLASLKHAGYRIFAAEVKVPGKWVLLMGHEGKGISPEVLEACDETVMIEMESGVKSFNVGVAASIMMYRLCHR